MNRNDFDANSKSLYVRQFAALGLEKQASVQERPASFANEQERLESIELPRLTLPPKRRTHPLALSTVFMAAAAAFFFLIYSPDPSVQPDFTPKGSTKVNFYKKTDKGGVLWNGSTPLQTGELFKVEVIAPKSSGVYLGFFDGDHRILENSKLKAAKFTEACFKFSGSYRLSTHNQRESAVVLICPSTLTPKQLASVPPAIKTALDRETTALELDSLLCSLKKQVLR